LLFRSLASGRRFIWLSVLSTPYSYNIAKVCTLIKSRPNRAFGYRSIDRLRFSGGLGGTVVIKVNHIIGFVTPKHPHYSLTQTTALFI